MIFSMTRAARATDITCDSHKQKSYVCDYGMHACIQAQCIYVPSRSGLSLHREVFALRKVEIYALNLQFSFKTSFVHDCIPRNFQFLDDMTPHTLIHV